MDTTPEYVLMCKKAVEVQGLWDKEYGDDCWIADRRLSYGHDFYWLEEYGNGKECKLFVSGYHESDNPTWLGKTCIWLPRQDQLQEISGVNWIEFWNGVIKGWTDPNEFDSLEKSALASIMYEKYGKFWSGTDWADGRE